MIKEKDGQPSPAQKILEKLGQDNGFEFTFTKDGSVFTPENIAKYDAFFFYTTGDLTKTGLDKNPPMSKEGKAAFPGGNPQRQRLHWHPRRHRYVSLARRRRSRCGALGR